MVSYDLGLTYTIVWSLALANVIGAGLCIVLSSPIARLTTIRFTLLAPFLFMMISFAAFQSRQELADLAALFAMGFVGIMLKRFDWSRPAFLIGFVLSYQAENFTNMANQVAHAKFRIGFDTGLAYVASPIVLIILAMTVASIFFGIRQAKQILPEGEVSTGGKRAPMIFLLVVTFYLVVAWINAFMIDLTSDKVFPLAVGSVTLLCCFALLARMMIRPESDAVFADGERDLDGLGHRGLWRTLAWFGALLLGSALFGFILALVGFFLAFFRFRAGLNWSRTLLLSSAGIAFICAMAGTLHRDFPPGLLQEFVKLPWPLT